jgi:hypothetical protein
MGPIIRRMACGMTDSATWLMIRGYPQAPPPRSLLSAGRLSACLEGDDVVDVRFGGLELARRVGVRVRGPAWETVAPQMRDFEIGSSQAAFAIRNSRREVDFRWRGRVELEPHALTYEMDGWASAPFDFNRIGIVILHPPAVTAGRRFRARGSGGRDLVGELPRLVAPQPIIGGEIQPLVAAFSRLEIEIEAGLRVVLELEGDVFEMEDQRNWTDGSFKTYSTPVGRPVPYRAEVGQPIVQRARIEFLGKPPRGSRTVRAGAPTVEVRLGDHLGSVLPPVGVALDADGHEPDARELALLRALAPAHLRVEINGDGASAAFVSAAEFSARIGAPLELSLTLSGDRRCAGSMLRDLSGLLGSLRPVVARVLVFHAEEKVTTPGWLDLAREVLCPSPEVPLIIGTAAHFAELNREPPAAGARFDGLVYSVTPQVHDFDDASIFQTLSAQADTVKTAQSFAPGAAVHVSPVTLRPRAALQVARSGAVAPDGELPPDVDPRQASLLAAAFTLGSIKQLGEAGAASMTYYETTGWRGLMERAPGSLLPQRFPSRAGHAFPVYHVLRDVCAWRGAKLQECRTSDRSAVEAMAVHRDGKVRLLVANITPKEVRVSIDALASRWACVRALDARTAPPAGGDPHQFAHAGAVLEAKGGRLSLVLGPYAVARVLERAATG